MFREWQQIFEKELSGKQAYRYAERIAQYHRIQASPGYRDAANEVLKLLKRDGVEANLISYPAKFGEKFLANSSFKEWNCLNAELWIEQPEKRRIARFEEEEISIVQRSISTPKGGLCAELVVIEHAEEERSYEGIDIKGKIALVRGNPFVIHALAVEKYGAAGLIFDNLNEYPPFRTRMDMPDTRQYTSYWWQTEESIKSFGFVVSPRLGDELKKIASQSVVKLNAKVEAELYDGSFENIEYFIPGESTKEILLVSHLCHPYPGGQDNASGPGTLMETMRTLTKLIATGQIPKPQLGIRFLMMPEMTGTAAYFEQHPERIEHTIAALNLDMVGADQAKGGGPLCIEQPPMATPSFVDRFAYQLVESIARNTSNFSGTTHYSTVHFIKSRFSGGSDHYIISDPTIGIPCPMLIQWPDRHYHTTDDSPRNLDPKMMELVAKTTALYAYGLANGSEEDWREYLFSHTNKSLQSLIEGKDWVMKQSFTLKETQEALKLFCQYQIDSINEIIHYALVRDFKNLVGLAEWSKGMIQKQIEHFTELIKKELEYQTFSEEPVSHDWGERVYKRTYRGPVSFMDIIKDLSHEEKLNWLKEFEFSVPMGYGDFILYWMDGKRSVNEIMQMAKYETGQFHPEYVREFMKLYEKLGYIAKIKTLHNQ